MLFYEGYESRSLLCLTRGYIKGVCLLGSVAHSRPRQYINQTTSGIYKLTFTLYAKENTSIYLHHTYTQLHHAYGVLILI